MAQISKFRNFLLLPRHSSSPLSLSKPSNFQFRSLLTVIASSKRHRTIASLRRKSTTPKPMEVKESSFNKRRAEGRDSSDASRKNLQLKVRKLNPINTISYVQVSKFPFLSQNGYLFSLLQFFFPLLSITDTGNWNGYSRYFSFSPAFLRQSKVYIQCWRGNSNCIRLLFSSYSHLCVEAYVLYFIFNSGIAKVLHRA